MDSKMRIKNLNKDISSIRREASKDFLKFRQYYFSHYHKFPDAKFHGEVCQLLKEMTYQRGMKIALAAPRESAKSTIVTTEYCLYCICHKIEPFILVMSSTAEQVEHFLCDIKRELETNPPLIQDFPDVCEIGIKPGPPRWTKNQIITRNGVNVLVLSVNQQVRGLRHGEFRPSLIVLDDIEAEQSAYNPDNFYKLQDTITKSVIRAGTNRTNVVYIGTIHHYNSLLAQFTSQTEFPGWIKRIYRSVISWSEHPELWEQWVKIYHCQEEYKGKGGPEAAHEFFKDNSSVMLQGTQVLWLESRSYYNLMVEREQLGYISFDSEMQNEPVNPRDCHFNLDEVHYCEEEYKTEEELFNARGDKLLIIGSCDPSMGKQNRNADFSAILTGAFDTETGIIYLLDADIARRKPDKIIDDIIAYHTRRKYDKFAFETNQFQEYMAEVLNKKANGRLNIEQINHSTNKFARIESLQPLIKNGTIRISKKQGMILEQMKFFPKWKFDDGLDALEMLVAIAQKPQKVQVFISGPGNFDDSNWYNDYRKAFGWPPLFLE